MRSSLVLFQVNTAARSWLQGLTLSAVPRAKFAVTFSRASGPGGQKVNKTSSKSTITLPSLQHADWIPQDVRHQLKERRFRYLTKSGSVVISSDVSRSQQENLDLCFDKFCNEVKRTAFFPDEVSPQDIQKWEKVQKRTNERRLQDKKFNSQRKQSRKVNIY